MNKDLTYYLSLNWTYRFEWSDEDKTYIATVAELNGCMTDGQTIETAAAMIKDALKSYIETFLGLDKEIPEPAKSSDFKGNIPFRTTSEQHYKLHKKAAIEGISINKVIQRAVEKETA